MSLCKQGLAVAAISAAMLWPSMSRAQEPSWALQLLSNPPTVVATTGVTPFDRAIQSDFGAPLVAGLPELTYTWTQGSAPQPGMIELGAIASDTDDPATGSSIFVAPGTIDNEVGTLPLDDTTIPNGPADFFEANTGDGIPLDDPTWAFDTISAGNSQFLDLGTLDLSKLLSYYDVQGPGSYLLTLDYGVGGYNAANGDPLDPDGFGGEIPRVPGPPTVEVLLTVNAQQTPPPPGNGTPEPGSVATIMALSVAGGFAVRRRRK